MVPRILLLMPKASYRVERFIGAARRLGAEVRVGSDRCHVLAEEWGVPLALDFREPDSAVQSICAHAMQEPFDAIVATDDATTVIAARAAAKLGLAANAADAAYATRNKRVMRERLQAAGVPCPVHRVLAAEADESAVLAAAEELGFPVVVKPLLMAASRGVIRADDKAALTAAVARARAVLRAPDVEPSDDPAARELLVEEYVPGREVAVEAMLRDGELQVIAIFDKPDPLEGPFFEETIYVTPSRFEASLQQRIVEVAAEAARALGLRRGPVHAELRVTIESEVSVIEVAGRSIGGLCAKAVELASGQTLEELIIRDALGEPIANESRELSAAGVLMLPVPKRGILREVRGVDRAAAIEGIDSIDITAPVDHQIVPLPEGASYLGFVFARAATVEQVEAALRQAQVVIEPVIVDNLALRANSP